jgi:hypothetical protein
MLVLVVRRPPPSGAKGFWPRPPPSVAIQRVSRSAAPSAGVFLAYTAWIPPAE